jgi:hypothetical protein
MTGLFNRANGYYYATYGDYATPAEGTVPVEGITGVSDTNAWTNVAGLVTASAQIIPGRYRIYYSANMLLNVTDFFSMDLRIDGTDVPTLAMRRRLEGPDGTAVVAVAEIYANVIVGTTFAVIGRSPFGAGANIIKNTIFSIFRVT